MCFLPKWKSKKKSPVFYWLSCTMYILDPFFQFACDSCFVYNDTFNPMPKLVFFPSFQPTPRGPPAPQSYDPCAVQEACGPNAICTPVNGDPICSCPPGFSGIPRNGNPDPAHGCVRTPLRCPPAGDSSSCPIGKQTRKLNSKS